MVSIPPILVFWKKCNGWILVRPRRTRSREASGHAHSAEPAGGLQKGLLFQKRTAGMYGTGTLTFVLRVIKHLGRTADGVNLYQCQYMRLACAQRASVLWRARDFQPGRPPLVPACKLFIGRNESLASLGLEEPNAKRQPGGRHKPAGEAAADAGAHRLTTWRRVGSLVGLVASAAHRMRPSSHQPPLRPH